MDVASIKKILSSHNLDNPNIKSLEQYKTNILSKAELLIHHGIPAKIAKYNKLIRSPLFHGRNIAESIQKINIPIPGPAPVIHEKPVTRNTTHIECNEKIDELLPHIKAAINELVDDVNILKMWLSFLIPKIEDGNNFGVSIQETTLGEIHTVEINAIRWYGQTACYYHSRAHASSKITKYPHIQDYRYNLREIDFSEFWRLSLVLNEIRNHYCTLYDVIHKNLEKIKSPRTQANIHH